ncbi:MAG TPA: purine-nucleoside phosphorylase [Gemmatimonadaceae bacterium]
MPPGAGRQSGPAYEHVVERIEASAAVVRERLTSVPGVAIILGTGLGGLAGRIESPVTIAYGDIPGFPLSTVESHEGRLIAGRLAGRSVVAMQGRFHKYEGYSLQQATFPVRVLRQLGAGTLIVSNACGGMRPDWSAGDLMLLADHINLIGDHPLIGPNDERLGPRFPDCSALYDKSLRAVARQVAKEQGTTLREGVYVAVAGPNLETRAEYRMLRELGADVVGMSTVPEVLVAAQGGMRVLGISIITDMCIPETLEPATLEAILRVAGKAEPKLTALVEGVVERL